MILVPKEIKFKLLHAIYRSAGLKSEGQGIAFSIAVDEVVGLSGGPDLSKLMQTAAPPAQETPDEKPEQ